MEESAPAHVADIGVALAHRVVGLRYTHFKQQADLQGLGPLRLRGTIGGTEEWIEPIVGARIDVQINDRWSVGVLGNVGGFGIGDASDLSWRIDAGLGFRINNRLTVRGGLVWCLHAHK